MTVWTEVTEQTETWTALAQPTRGFDPTGFSNTPDFDTGAASGVWTEKTEQPEVWVEQ